MIPQSALLLQALLAGSEVSRPQLAQLLDCGEPELEALARGEPVMTLDVQMRLALLLIAEVPRLSRQGHSLKAQVTAATSFRRKEIGSHSEPPGRWLKPPRRGR